MSIPAFTGCTKGSYCSDQQATKVGSNQTQIYHRTVTTLTGQGPAYSGSKTETYIISKNAAGIDTWVLAATSTDGGKTQTFTSAAGADLKKSMAPGGNMYKNTQKQIQDTLTKGGAKQGLVTLPGTSGSLEKINVEQQKKLGIVSNSSASNSAQTDAQAAANEAEIKKELSEIKERKSYEPLIVYPEKLQLKYQDCIKFSMLKYQQSFLNLGANATRSNLGQVQRSVSLNGNNVPTVGNRLPITTIVLPISGGINDSNTVDWQGNVLDEITKAFAGIAQSTITKGAARAEESGQAAANAAQANVEGLKAFGTSKLTELATGASGIMQRQYGAITNPNLELLFNGPQLRTFSFSFRLSPRSETEAKIVQKIIRYFKQGMTPKRSSGYLLLQSPHTFAISYLTADKEHPYLNKFKECALTQCNVNYTPDGNYMSYDGAERSMTSYEVTLQFQELVPLFDDDYGDQDNDIGF